MGKEETGESGGGQVISTIKKIAEIVTFLQTRSEKADLAEARKQNNYCLHLLIMGGLIGDNPQNKGGEKQLINEGKGVFFSLNRSSRAFYHPDPVFTPAGNVTWLVRSEWKQDGLFQKHAVNFPVVEAVGIGYPRFWWRQTTNDKGGGDQREGFCRICAKAQKELEGI